MTDKQTFNSVSVITAAAAAAAVICSWLQSISNSTCNIVHTNSTKHYKTCNEFSH